MDQGYTKEILEDNVVAFRATYVSRECVDAWVQDVAAVFADALKQGTRARLLYDLRKVNIVTPYSLQRAVELEKLPLPPDWRVATLVVNPFIASVVNYAISISVTPTMREHSHVFANEAEALDWLHE
jgi:hypothetical protein